MCGFATMLLLFAAQNAAEPHVDAARKAELAGDFRAAEREYEQAVAIRKDAELFQRLGLVRHLQNKFQEAIPAFQESLRLNPDAWGARLFLGIDYYRTNQFSKALPSLNAARRLRPGEPEVEFWLGATFIALHRYFEGQEILEALTRKQPQNVEAVRILAQSYSDFAVELHNRVVAEHPDSAWAHRIHGQALENEGACEAALAEYRKATELMPGMKGLREAMSRCQARH